MRYAVVGWGRMGRAIDRVARDRGHRPKCLVDPAQDAGGDLPRYPSVTEALKAGALGPSEIDVAFEFSLPAAAASNVSRLVENDVRVVCGTTGWSLPERTVELLESGRGALVLEANFSIGVSLFRRIVAEAAARIGPTGLYDPYVVEHHHAGKADQPSGTARVLADLVETHDPRRPKPIVGSFDGCLPSGAFHVSSVRGGGEPGTHVVGYDGAYDRIELVHRARDRSVFAVGAVIAAEWLADRRGKYGLDEVLEDLHRAAGERRSTEA